MENENVNNSNSDSSAGLKALRSLKQVSPEPSPFLEARVTAHFRENLKTKQKSIWLPLMSGALASAFILAFAFSFFLKSQTSHLPAVADYLVGQDYVIRMDIRALKETPIAYAEVVLEGDNVHFSSGKFASISQQRKLVISWDSLVEKQFLPIVLKAMSGGKSKVVVNFYDAENKLVNSRDLDLNFKGG